MFEIVQSVAKQAAGAELFTAVGSSYGGYVAPGLARIMPDRLLGASL